MDSGLVINLVEGADGMVGFHAYDPVSHPDGNSALADALRVFGVKAAPTAKAKTGTRNVLTGEATTRRVIARQVAQRAAAQQPTAPTLTNVVSKAAARAGHNTARAETNKSADATFADAIAHMRARGRQS